MKPKIFCPYCAGRFETRPEHGRSRLHCPACAAYYYENPVPCSVVVIVDEAGRVLLVKRGVPPQKGMWALPGGFIDLGEEPAAAARREVNEETGLAAAGMRLLDCRAQESKRYGNVILIAYQAEKVSGEAAAGDDAEALDYFDPADLPELAFDSHRDFIRQALGQGG